MKQEYAHKFNKITKTVEKWRKEMGIPGVVLGVSIDGEEYIDGLGVTNHAHPVEVDRDTIGQIGSITKTFTATAIMRLVDQGRVDLDASVQTYLPDFRVLDDDVSKRVTVRHLLSHNSGWIGDFYLDTGRNDDTLELFVQAMADLPQLAPLCEIVSYNNAGFSVAGRLIEVLTDLPFEDAMKNLVFEPLHLEHSFFFANDVMPHRFLVGHKVQTDQHGHHTVEVIKPWAFERSLSAAGGIASNIHDLFKYAHCHMQMGAPLLTPESAQAMRTTGTYVNKAIGGIGLGWWIRNVNGTKVVYHSGGTEGQVSVLRWLPVEHIAFAMLTNARQGGLLIKQFSSAVLKEFVGIKEHKPEVIELPQDIMQEYVGFYSRPIMNVDVKLVNGKLTIIVTNRDTPAGVPPQEFPPMPLGAIGEDKLIVTDGPMQTTQIDILRDSNGQITYLRLGSRIHRRKE